jgi:MFS family permease
MSLSPVSPVIPNSSMSGAEIRASVSLAGIFALRMLGLFLILPVFSIHAATLSGGQNAALVGLAMGVYGLVQAFGQLPFGIASDKFGRKPVIVLGLIIFALGSFIAAAATSIEWVIVGRAVQGGGAISAAVTALIADATRDQHRTKAMAMVGGSIALTFALSLILAPLLYQSIGMAGIFGITGGLALAAILVVLYVVPAVPMVKTRRVNILAILKNAELMRLNYGVFVLHMVQIAMFVVIPPVLVEATGLPLAEHWKIYLPVVLASFVLMLPPIFASEKYGKVKQAFVGAISLLLLVQIGLWFCLSGFGGRSAILVSLLLAFFVAFNILEASQPSLVSRIAPPEAKGTALGAYNTMQSLGLFCGGAFGGLIKQTLGASSVFLFGTVLTVGWLIIASSMKNPPLRVKATPASAAGVSIPDKLGTTY